MKNMLKAMAGIVLLAAFGGIGSAYGQNHMYTNAVLKGAMRFWSQVWTLKVPMQLEKIEMLSAPFASMG